MSSIALLLLVCLLTTALSLASASNSNSLPAHIDTASLAGTPCDAALGIGAMTTDGNDGNHIFIVTLGAPAVVCKLRFDAQQGKITFISSATLLDNEHNGRSLYFERSSKMLYVGLDTPKGLPGHLVVLEQESDQPTIMPRHISLTLHPNETTVSALAGSDTHYRRKIYAGLHTKPARFVEIQNYHRTRGLKLREGIDEFVFSMVLVASGNQQHQREDDNDEKEESPSFLFAAVSSGIIKIDLDLFQVADSSEFDSSKREKNPASLITDGDLLYAATLSEPNSRLIRVSIVGGNAFKRITGSITLGSGSWSLALADGTSSRLYAVNSKVFKKSNEKAMTEYRVTVIDTEEFKKISLLTLEGLSVAAPTAGSTASSSGGVVTAALGDFFFVAAPGKIAAVRHRSSFGSTSMDDSEQPEREMARNADL